jgi:REP element-mobilizing transposase RayT
MLASSLCRYYNPDISHARRIVIGHHLIWTLYGHWLVNDLRGSGSEAVRDPKFAPLRDLHLGGKPEHLQPSSNEVKGFYRKAAPLLQFTSFWIDEAKRQALAASMEEVVKRRAYTAWACAILSNHIYLVVRQHRDDGITIWNAMTDATRARLRQFAEIDDAHPVWAARPYKVYLWTPQDVRTRVRYVSAIPRRKGSRPSDTNS